MGFEATTIYAEEARDPDVTIPRATYLSVLLIGLFFVFTTWLMIAGVGAANLIPTLENLQDPTSFFFELAGRYVGGPVPAIAGVLLVSSLFAALSAFHNYIARYSYVAGREGLLPAAFGRTHATHQSPHVGSLAQSIGALIVLAVFAGLGLDPILNMFTWISQIGVLGVLGMMSITSLAVVAFFRRHAQASLFTAWVMPVLSGLIMAALFVYIFANFGDLTGTQGASLGIILPSLIPVAAVVGWLLASRLRSSSPRVFANMGASRS
jgi:amino acid transporter